MSADRINIFKFYLWHSFEIFSTYPETTVKIQDLFSFQNFYIGLQVILELSIIIFSGMKFIKEQNPQLTVLSEEFVFRTFTSWKTIDSSRIRTPDPWISMQACYSKTTEANWLFQIYVLW